MHFKGDGGAGPYEEVQVAGHAAVVMPHKDGAVDIDWIEEINGEDWGYAVRGTAGISKDEIVKVAQSLYEVK